MAQNANVIDELVVKLRLDTTEYNKSEKAVNEKVDKTERKLTDQDGKRKKRETDQIKRTKEATAATKGWTMALSGLTLVAGTAALAITASVGAVTMLAGFETNLRRAAVSTNLSNREMQAWGSTARRLGADAQAGAQAIGDLAREQQQFNVTGNAPTMAALSRLGVRVGTGVPIADMLAQAQQIYRNSSPAQQQQIEAGLAAQGVSNDLIVMIKSETDAREAYTRSFNESATENRKALDAVTEALASVEASAINVANTIATLVQPAVEQFAKWLSEGVQQLSAWNDRLIAAGGGLQGLTKVLTEDFPGPMAVVTNGLRVLGEAVDVVAYGLNELWKAVKSGWSWFTSNPGVQKEGAQIMKDLGRAGDWLSEKWGNLVGNARSKGPSPVANWLNSSGPQPGAGAPRAVGTAQDLMSKLVTQYGLTVPQAAAVAANFGGESGFNPAAFNPAGGGTGARGLGQWRGARTEAFKKRFGILPDQASIDQQLNFIFNDPYERSLLKRSLGGEGGADDYGRAFSTIFEAHGNAAETARRGKEAARLAAAYNGPAGEGAGTASAPAININGPITVQANNPAELVGGIQRVAGPQNYNSGNR